MAQLYGTELEAKKPMKRWQKIAISAVAAFAVFVAIKFTEDSYADLSKSCMFYGGTPAARSLFTSTESCTWPNRLAQRQVNFMGTMQRGFNVAVQFCRLYKGRLSSGENTEPVVCSFAKAK